MENNKSNVINLNEHRKKESSHKSEQYNVKERVLEDSFYDELRKIKRKEKGLVWD